MWPGTRVAKRPRREPRRRGTRHEERAAADDAFEGSEEATATGELGVGGHLDGGGHPGELAGLGDDGVVVVEGKL